MIQWLFVENSPSLFTVRRRVALVFGLVPIVCVVLLAAARISLPIRCLRLTGFLPASEDRMPAVEGCASATCGPGKMQERHVCTDHYSIWGWQVCVLHQRTGCLLWKVAPQLLVGLEKWKRGMYVQTTTQYEADRFASCTRGQDACCGRLRLCYLWAWKNEREACMYRPLLNMRLTGLRPAPEDRMPAVEGCASATCGPGKMQERHVCTDHYSIWGWQVFYPPPRTGCLLWKVAPLLLVGLEKWKRGMYVQTTTQYEADRFASCTRGQDACCGRLRLCYLWAWKNERETCMYRPLINMRRTGLRPAPEDRMPAVEGCASATCGPGKMKERHVCTDHYSIWGWQVFYPPPRTGCLLWKVAPQLLVGLEKCKRGMYVQTTTQYEADRFASCTRGQDACCGRLRLCYLWAAKNARDTCIYRPLINVHM